MSNFEYHRRQEQDTNEMEVVINERHWRVSGGKAAVLSFLLLGLGMSLLIWVVAAFLLGSRDIIHWIFG